MYRVYGRAARAAGRPGSRRCLFEALEPRIALSGTPPQVVDVVVSSTEWSPSFISYLQDNSLGTGGYSIPVGSSAQLTPLPWNNLNQIKITFSKDVHVQSADLAVTGKNVTSYAFAGFSYDPQARLATWTLAASLAVDKILLDLDANGIDPVRDLAGNILDGEWTNGSSTYASGNGTAGGDFEFLFQVQPGDVSGNGLVNYIDYNQTNALQGKGVSDAGYSHRHDVNGSGLINAADTQAVLARLWNVLPSGNPAGIGNDAPTTKGFDWVYINNDAVDVAISLWNAYADVESGSNGLDYSVKSNSAPSLFDSVSINPATGMLILNAAQAAMGRALITIVGTDPGGIATESTVTIDVNRVNQAPVISNFLAQHSGDQLWHFSGKVTDPDDDVAKWIVALEGVFDARVATDDEGWFQFSVSLDPYVWGDEMAVTWDPHGLESNVPVVFVGLT